MRGIRGSRELVDTAVVVILALVAGSCGGDSADTETPVAGIDALPRDVCDLVTELEQADELLLGPDVFDHDASRLDEIFTDKRELLRTIAERSTGDLQRRLHQQLVTQEAMDEAILERWDIQRDALASEHDDSPWVPRILEDTIAGSDGVKVDLDDFFGAASANYNELVVRCRAPELADPPRPETTEEPPPGRLMFVGMTDGDDRAQGERLRLMMTDPEGGTPRELTDPAPWQVLGQLDVARGESPEIVVVARHGDTYGLVLTDDSGAVRHVAARGAGQLGCPTWNDAGDQVLAMLNSSDADERKLRLIDLTGRHTSGPLELPFAVAGCGAFITEDRLVVADAALTVDGDRGVWIVGIDGSDPQELYAPENCRTDVGSVDPTGARVAVTQRCFDPLKDGVWVVDLSSGEADHIVTGLAGPAGWSPDGTWLVFGLSPLIGNDPPRVWMARADGRQLRQVVETPSWTPVWLPPT
jgi:hypothetical protein